MIKINIKLNCFASYKEYNDTSTILNCFWLNARCNISNVSSAWFDTQESAITFVSLADAANYFLVFSL